MKKFIYDHNGNVLLAEVEADPHCGEAYCDRCGDCLACSGGDSCIDGYGDHFWVQYEKS